jgi:hypothetical protein
MIGSWFFRKHQVTQDPCIFSDKIFFIRWLFSKIGFTYWK